RADQQDLRVQQLELALLADLGDQQVPGIARPLLRRKRARQNDLEPVSLPVGEPTGERMNVFVPELPERLRSKRRAVADGAVEDDRLRLVGGNSFDAALEIAPRDVDGAGEVTLLPF